MKFLPVGMIARVETRAQIDHGSAGAKGEYEQSKDRIADLEG